MSALDDLVNLDNWELENNKPIMERNWIFVGDTRPSDANDEVFALRTRIAELEADVEAFDVVHKNDVAVIDSQCLELQKYQWQPIETAPKDGTEVMLSDGEYMYFGSCFEHSWNLWIADGISIDPIYWKPRPALPQPPEEK